MITASIWLTKLILAHLLTDFILQPGSWVKSRNEKHFTSKELYLHGLTTAIVALLMLGLQYWPVAIIILITHIIIDGWKSYQKSTAGYFIIDQAMHFVVIVVCWYFSFFSWKDVTELYRQVSMQPAIWKVICGFVFVTSPAGILIGQLTKQWREKIENVDEESLANAGKWIGMIERIIILVFVLQGQYSAIGLLVAAKGIIRFNEKDRQEIKTEYLVIGTLMSIVLAITTGLILKA